MHICGDKSDNEDGDKDSACKNMSTNSQGEDILDRQACNDIVYSELHSDAEKQQILQTNCLSLLQTVPFNFELATFCFSHSKFFQLKKDDSTLGLRMQQIINIFNDEFKKELSKHHVWVVVCLLQRWVSRRCIINLQNMLEFQKQWTPNIWLDFTHFK